MATIDIEKTNEPASNSFSQDHSDRIQNMEEAIRKFFIKLQQRNDDFQPASAFNELLSYITIHDRVLYSTISNIIYYSYESSGNFDPSGTLLSNLDALVRYSEDPNNILAIKKSLSEHQSEKTVDDTRKAVLKIWDHVTLASQQYTMLKQSDAEYDEKFKKRISTFKEDMTREMNAQMITMVGIFTALAFLIFGSISSLDGIFENVSIPIFKVMSIGLIWGLCVSNMIFVFLYCIGKMTKLNFKANKDSDASIFQKYPIVWWVNFTLISLLLITVWGYFIQQTAPGVWLINQTNSSPQLAFILGSFVILLLIIVGYILLCRSTRKHK